MRPPRRGAACPAREERGSRRGGAAPAGWAPGLGAGGPAAAPGSRARELGMRALAGLRVRETWERDFRRHPDEANEQLCSAPGTAERPRRSGSKRGAPRGGLARREAPVPGRAGAQPGGLSPGWSGGNARGPRARAGSTRSTQVPARGRPERAGLWRSEHLGPLSSRSWGLAVEPHLPAWAHFAAGGPLTPRLRPRLGTEGTTNCASLGRRMSLREVTGVEAGALQSTPRRCGQGRRWR